MQGDVTVRRASFPNYRVEIHDLSLEGCRFKFVDRPLEGERVWVKLDGIEAVESTVLWVDSGSAGVRFERPLHPAVFDLLVHRMRGDTSA